LPATIAMSGESALFLGAGNTQGRNSALAQIHDTFSWTKGTHQFQFGFDETDIVYNDFFHSPAAGSIGFGIDAGSPDPAAGIFDTAHIPGISSTDLGALEGVYASLVGRITSYSNNVAFNPKTRQFQTGLNQTDDVHKLELGFFGGDSWRVRPTLTFNYGLRWEYDGPPNDNNNQYFMNTFNSVWGVSGVGNLFNPNAPAALPSGILYTNDKGKSWYNKYYRALAPSVGLAWQPSSDNSMLKHVLGGPGKTVIRAGYSIAYSREGLNSYFGISQSNPGYFGGQQAQSCPANNAATGCFQAGTMTLGQAAGFNRFCRAPAHLRTSSVWIQHKGRPSTCLTRT